MSPAKLSEADKNQILQLYRQTEETTSTLSSRFGVSSSTISRFLKNELSEREYEDLIQQKRLARTVDRPKEAVFESIETSPIAQQLEISLSTPSLEIIEDGNEPTPELAVTEKESLRRRQSRTKVLRSNDNKPIPKAKQTTPEVGIIPEPSTEIDEVDEVGMANIGAMFGEDLMNDDLSDDDFEEDDDFDDDEELEMLAYSIGKDRANNIQVLPFTAANLPRTCYIVVDRLAELITRPLREFGDLGAIPTAEIQAQTLPIFDNHRVARRFSHRSHRVIKIPNAPRLLEKTSSHLQAKGITRLFLDGQVYSIDT
jgi:transposase-like protein